MVVAALTAITSVDKQKVAGIVHLRSELGGAHASPLGLGGVVYRALGMISKQRPLGVGLFLQIRGLKDQSEYRIVRAETIWHDLLPQQDFMVIN